VYMKMEKMEKLTYINRGEKGELKVRLMCVFLVLSRVGCNLYATILAIKIL
jgi:hypothetical protein